MNLTTLTKKYRSGDRMLKKEEDYLWKKLRTKADSIFSKRIRNRDEGKNCISYGALNCKNRIEQACHRIDRGRYSHRRDENNVFGGCASCNGFNKQEHQQFFTARQVKVFGQERVEEQLRSRHKKKPSIGELLDIIDKYTG